MQNIEFGESHAINLLVDLFERDEVSAGVYHDSTEGEEGGVFD